MAKQVTLDGKEADQVDVLKRIEIEEEYGEVDPDLIDTYDVYRAEQQAKAHQLFSQHEKRPPDAEGYVRLPGPCGSTHLMPIEDYMAKNFHHKRKLPDVLRFFKCHRCERVVDRDKELMMQYSGGNQTLGLQRPFRSFCLDCYCIVSKEGRGLGGLTGREFASVASEIMNDRRRSQ